VQGSVGLAVGGEGGSALLEMLHMSTSPDTLQKFGFGHVNAVLCMIETSTQPETSGLKGYETDLAPIS